MSVVLYGSAAVPGAKDHLSDFNILCVLTEVTPEDLRSGRAGLPLVARDEESVAAAALASKNCEPQPTVFRSSFTTSRIAITILFGEDVSCES